MNGGERVASSLLELTDEEVLALTGADDSPVVLPHAAGLSVRERHIATTVALRGLVRRGLLELPPPAAVAAAEARGAATLDVSLSEPLLTVLASRSAAVDVVCLRRRSVDGEDFRYLHRGPEGILDERVSACGVHRFDRLAPAQVVPSVLDYALAPEALDALDAPDAPAGAAVVLGVEALEQLPGAAHLPGALAAATRATDIVRHRPGQRPGLLLGLFSGPEGILLVASRFGSANPVRLVPVGRAEVAAAVGALVTDEACASGSTRPAQPAVG